MGRIRNIAGQKFGRLTCIKVVGADKRKRALWLCQCSCGMEKIVLGNSLVTGVTKSCGCLQKEKAAETGRNKRTHGFGAEGKCSSGLYKSWSHMKQRCMNKKCQDYHRYGGRGIKVCEEWLDFDNFHRWAINNGYEKGRSIERINNDGDYCPSNCKWATAQEQNNNKRSNRKVTLNGESKNVQQWARELGINASTLYTRLNDGWSDYRALTEPVRTNKISNIERRNKL